jgi:hypothetical protein
MCSGDFNGSDPAGRSVASITGQNLKDCNGIRWDDAYIIRGSPI